MLPTTDPHSLCCGGLYLLLIMLVGYATVSAIVGGGVRHWVQTLAYCYAAGTGVIGFSLFLISLAGFKPCAGILIGIAIVAILMIVLLLRRESLCVLSVPSPRGRIGALTLLGILSLGLIVSAGANVATTAAWPGLNDIDSFGIWAFKAKWVFLAPLRPLPRAFVDPLLSYAHQDYPLGVPFNIAGLYAVVGKVDEDAAKMLLVPTWLALTGIIYGAIRRIHRRAIAVTLTAIFCSAPNLTQNAGLIVAETPLILALAGAASQLLCWIESGDRRELMLGGLFIAMAAFTKNEGLALLPVYGLVAMIAASLPSSTGIGEFPFWSPLPVLRERVRVRAERDQPFGDHGKAPSPPPSPGVPGEGVSSWRKTFSQLWPAAMLCLLCIGPWLIFRRHLPYTHEDYGGRLLSAAVIRQIPQRLGGLGQFFQRFADGRNAGLIWYLLALTTILWPRALLGKAAVCLWAILLVQMTLYLATFIVTPWEVNVLVPMITPKLQTQMTPVAILIIALNVRSISAGDPRRFGVEAETR
jgi:hypothetical protein